MISLTHKAKKSTNSPVLDFFKENPGIVESSEVLKKEKKTSSHPNSSPLIEKKEE